MSFQEWHKSVPMQFNIKSCRGGSKNFLKTGCNITSVKSLTAGVKESLYKDPEMSGILDALSCYLNLILNHCQTSGLKKIIVDQNLEGCSPVSTTPTPACMDN